MRRQITQYSTFLREFRRTFDTTGALTPSGRWLARKLVGGVVEENGPRRIMEVGPGTGAVTRELVRHMGPEDSLHLVELNDRFVRVLEHRLDTEPDFQRVADRVEIFHRPVQELPVDQPYDHIICGIPFNNLSPDLVKSIFQHMVDSLRDGGTLSFFEYLWVRQFRMLAISRKERLRVASVGSVLQSYLDRYECRNDKVYLNVLPAVAHHLCIEANGSSEHSHAAIAD